MQIDLLRFQKIALFVFGAMSFLSSQAQDTQSSEVLDGAYREDQIYFGITYNLLNKMPSEMAQIGFSSGFHLGVIRDFPLNEKRNVAFGLGLGYSGNSVNQNLLISENENGPLTYAIGSTDTFSKNKFSMHLLELPLELRFRSSTADNYQFWRVYAGFKMGYLIHSTVKYRGQPSDYKIKQVEDFKRFHYGLTLSVGYDKFNAHLYYGLNPLFDEVAKLNDEILDLRLIKIGLMLYIL